MQYEFKLIILMVPVIAFLFYFSQTKKSSLSVLASIYLILIVSITLFSIGKYIYANYDQPPKWDFLVFWLNGKVGISGENFYNPDNYREVALPYDPGDDFRDEIIDTGFWYPPFAMFLFLPLGLFDISKAYILWQILNLLLCIACVYGLWSLFLKDYGILSLLLTTTLMLRLEPSRSTFSFAQTNFLALLFFLMFWQNRSKGWGGIWLAFCVVIKPYMALLYIYPFLTGKWRVLMIAVLTLLTITFLSGVAFGSDVFISYLNNPSPNVPGYVYTEMVNQSLLATILRLSQHQIIEESPLLNRLYLGISLLLTLITVWVTIKKNSNYDWALLSILFLALLVYPATLEHYSVFLIIPIVLLLKQSNQSVLAQTIVFFIIFVTYILVGYESGRYTFFANAFMWLVCITMGMGLSIDEITNRIIKNPLGVVCL